MSAPATAAPEENATIMALLKVTFTSVSNGKRLDLHKTDKNSVVTTPAPGTAQSWRINTANSDSGFAIVNDTIGKCLEPNLPDDYMRPAPCDGRASEKWYFQPVARSAQKAFMIRDEAENKCLTRTPPDSYGYEMTKTEACDGSKAQQWTVPDDAYNRVFDMAVDHAAARCTKDTSTCSWTTTTQQKPAALPQVCVSHVWFNDTDNPIEWTFSLNTSSGWTNTVGASLTLGLELGGGKLPIMFKVTAEVHGSISMNLKEDMGNSLKISVKNKSYGWIALSELATKVTGTWTFDVQGGFAWTVEDTVTVPLKHDSAGGASVYHAKVKPEFTSCAG